MTFNSLPQPAQIALSFAIVDYLKDVPADLFPPVLASGDWYKVFTALDVKIRHDGLIMPAEIMRAVEYVESGAGALLMAG